MKSCMGTNGDPSVITKKSGRNAINSQKKKSRGSLSCTQTVTLSDSMTTMEACTDLACHGDYRRPVLAQLQVQRPLGERERAAMFGSRGQQAVQHVIPHYCIPCTGTMIVPPACGVRMDTTRNSVAELSLRSCLFGYRLPIARKDNVPASAFVSGGK